MTKLLVIHGPNLNLLGTRESQFYANITLKDLNQQIAQHAKKHTISFFQSNAEHEIIEKIHHCPQEGISCIIINPAAFTHTSIALRDALLGVKVPFYEVHLSNIYARESFRHYSYLSDIAIGVVSGLGPRGYFVAVEAALEKFSAH